MDGVVRRRDRNAYVKVTKKSHPHVFSLVVKINKPAFKPIWDYLKNVARVSPPSSSSFQFKELPLGYVDTTTKTRLTTPPPIDEYNPFTWICVIDMVLTLLPSLLHQDRKGPMPILSTFNYELFYEFRPLFEEIMEIMNKLVGDQVKIERDLQAKELKKEEAMIFINDYITRNKITLEV